MDKVPAAARAAPPETGQSRRRMSDLFSEVRRVWMEVM